MKSQLKAGKLFLVGSLVLLSSLFISIGSASAAVVANTNTCYSGKTIDAFHGTDSYDVVWNDDNSFTISVSTPLKQNLQLYVSDYILTSPNYAGGCFSRSASSGTYPQTWYNTTIVNLPAGFSGTQTVSVDLPTECENLQVDLYTGDIYGNPLDGTVGQSGHDNYGYLAGNIMLTANNPACNTPVTPPTPPTAPTTPTTPTTPAAPSTPQVLGATTTKPAAMLSDTGLNIRLTSALAAMLLASAIFVATRPVALVEHARGIQRVRNSIAAVIIAARLKFAKSNLA